MTHMKVKDEMTFTSITQQWKKNMNISLLQIFMRNMWWIVIRISFYVTSRAGLLRSSQNTKSNCSTKQYVFPLHPCHKTIRYSGHATTQITTQDYGIYRRIYFYIKASSHVVATNYAQLWNVMCITWWGYSVGGIRLRYILYGVIIMRRGTDQ